MDFKIKTEKQLRTSGVDVLMTPTLLIKCIECGVLKEKEKFTICACGGHYCPACVCSCSFTPSREKLCESHLKQVARHVLLEAGHLAVDAAVGGVAVIEDEYGAFIVYSRFSPKLCSYEPLFQSQFSDCLSGSGETHFQLQQRAVDLQRECSYIMHSEKEICPVSIYPFLVDGDRFTVTLFKDDTYVCKQLPLAS